MNGFPLVFGNPWGALALLGIPVVIAIHCLQQKSRRLSVSTLFLLERLAPDSRKGRHLTWLRSSLPFWLQIFSVLLLAWILLDPRWLQGNAMQRIVLVLDSSISLRAFSGDIVARTSRPLEEVAHLAPRTLWTALETDPAQPVLYEGTDLSALEGKLRTWNPTLPANDPTRALGLARAIAPADALVIFVTDRPRVVPSGVEIVSVGEPIENCGLVGLRVTGTGDDVEWQVLAQNYGSHSARRSWWIESSGKKSEAASLDLEPGHSQILRGKFPHDAGRLVVCLEPDRFTVDDQMPIVRPEPKILRVAVNGDDATRDVFDRLMRTLPALSPAAPGNVVDFALETIGPKPPYPDNKAPSVVLLDNPSETREFVGEPFVSEADPLNRDLNWQGLVAQRGPMPPRDPSRRVLLWKDSTPMIFVQGAGDRRQLFFNFNFPASNASRLPAFVLLVDRFADLLRQDKRAPESVDVELAQTLLVAADAAGPSLQLHDDAGTSAIRATVGLVPVRAPSLPGFFTVTQNKSVLLTGAAGFGDVRESDFRLAATFDSLHGRRAKLLSMHTRGDVLQPLWLALVGALLVLYWAATRPAAS